MVQLLQCSSAHMPSRPLVVFSIFLLIASSMEAAAQSDARMLPLPLELSTTTKEQQEAAATRLGMEGRRALIGSRPPRCERACMSCGHCEAVQVPIVPQQEHEQHRQKRATTTATSSAAAAAMFSYRVNGITNYKPLSWKCRCGGTILDP